MLYWTLQWIIISLVLIMLIHYLYSFFKNTLTVPKVKDLVNKPTERYNEILETIKTPKPKAVASDPEIKTEMQNELRSFLQDLKKPKTNIDTPAAANDGHGAFSSY
jgi:hypothetical protein